MCLLRNQIITYTNFPKKYKCCVTKEINDKLRYLQTIEMIWEKKEKRQSTRNRNNQNYNNYKYKSKNLEIALHQKLKISLGPKWRKRSKNKPSTGTMETPDNQQVGGAMFRLKLLRPPATWFRICKYLSRLMTSL